MTAKKSQQPSGPVLRHNQCSAYIGLGHTAYGELISKGEIDPPFNVGPRAKAQFKSVLDDYLARKKAEAEAEFAAKATRDAQVKPAKKAGARS